jgi:NH3-dependent NAD+ synthetase
MDGIVPLNELNKTRVQNLGRGFATTVVPSSIWTNETSPFALVAAKKMLATGFRQLD